MSEFFDSFKRFFLPEDSAKSGKDVSISFNEVDAVRVRELKDYKVFLLNEKKKLYQAEASIRNSTQFTEVIVQAEPSIGDVAELMAVSTYLDRILCELQVIEVPAFEEFFYDTTLPPREAMALYARNNPSAMESRSLLKLL